MEGDPCRGYLGIYQVAFRVGCTSSSGGAREATIIGKAHRPSRPVLRGSLSESLWAGSPTLCSI